MKKAIKFSTLSILACTLIIVASPVSAGTQTVKLIADGPTDHIEVGEVIIEDNSTTMTITFEITDPDWAMTQTHLAVAESFEDIPQTGSGNPQVGKFTILGAPGGVNHDPPITTYTYDPFDVTPGTEYHIAAHATVISVIDGCWETVWQIGDEEVVNETTGWLENYADEFNWGDPAGPTTAGPSLAVEEPPFTNPFIVGTTPTNEFPYNSNKNRGYAIDFDVVWSGGLPVGGILILSWSPGQSAMEKKVISDGFPTETITATGTTSPGQGWFLDTYPLVNNIDDPIAVDPLSYGDHIINFQHTLGDGTFWDWIRLEKPCMRQETAWAEGNNFPGKNWATYFTHTTQCVEPDGSLSITGTGWKYVSAWCPCAYTYDLTETGSPIAFNGLIDVSEAAVADTGDWSKYYAKFSIIDSSGKTVEVVFGNDWLGPWYEMDAQPWDRIRMENNMSLAQPLQYYATVGGILGYNMDGTWVGPGLGATVYPSDGTYLIQLIVDPSTQIFTLHVYGMGSSAPANPPDTWPKQNMYNYPTWLKIGSINVSGVGFDFTEVNLCAILWASTQAGAEDTTTIHWSDIGFSAPDIP